MADKVTFTIEGVNAGVLINPFGATPDEVIAHVLDSQGVVGNETCINGVPVKTLTDRYFIKRECFEANTRLGELLLSTGTITEKQLVQALKYQEFNHQHMPLGEVIVQLQFCSQEQIEHALVAQSSLRGSLDQWSSTKTEWQDRLNTILSEIGT
jgi:hypothetical protein